MPPAIELELETSADSEPFFSICIPQHNRTDFLLAVLDSIRRQEFRAFEVCISDDCSNDGQDEKIRAFLRGAGFPFRYRRLAENVRYDANLRSAIDLARGRYCFLLGNDDALASESTLRSTHDRLSSAGRPAVAIANFEDFSSGRVTRRIPVDGSRGRGPAVAARSFRDFAFVSGVILDRERAQALRGEEWGKVEMYQMWLGSRIIAAGGEMLGIADSLVRKDVALPGIAVDSYLTKPRLDPCPIVERRLPLTDLGRLVADAIVPFVEPDRRSALAEIVFRQIFLFTYPFWLLEYRKAQSFNFAVGLALGMRPRNSLAGVVVSAGARRRLQLLFAWSTLWGLVAPYGLFSVLRPRLYALAKSLRSTSVAGGVR